MNYSEIFTTGPATADELVQTIRSLYSNGSTFQDYTTAKEWCFNNQETITAMASKLTIPQLNRYVQKTDKKRMVNHFGSAVLDMFCWDSITYSPFEEKYEDVLKKKIEAYTETDFLAYKQKLEAKRAAKLKALTNPENLDEFRTFITYKGEAALSIEQREKYDELMTGVIKHNKERDQERKAVVQAVAMEGVDMLIQKTVHTKKGHDLWVVKLSERVERFIFNDLNDRAKKLGGYYSSYKGNGAMPGFTFDNEEAAKLFIQIKDTDVNAVELRKAINAERQQERAENLQGKADNINERATETLNADRKDNTPRRARIATGIEQRAANEIEFSITMAKIAERMQADNLEHLKKLTTIKQLEQLDNVLYECKWSYIRENNIKSDNFELSTDIVPHAKMPYPVLYNESHTLNELKKLAGDSGKLMAAKRILKRLSGLQDGQCIEIKEGQSMEDFEKVFTWPSKNLDQWTKQRFKNMLLRYRRITSMGITTLFELRSALRELIRIKQSVSLSPEQIKMQQIRELEREFIGKKIDGFFPTTETMAIEKVKEANIQPGDVISEPSAGLGHIAEVITELHPDNELTCIEIYQPLAEALKLKGFNTLNEDFLQHTGQYDRIIMNPPFENNQDVDHVLHAWNLLKPGGRIVAIMAGNKEKQMKKVQDFMEFVDANGQWYQNPAGSFESAFRPTGVNTITVILDK